MTAAAVVVTVEDVRRLALLPRFRQPDGARPLPVSFLSGETGRATGTDTGGGR